MKKIIFLDTYYPEVLKRPTMASCYVDRMHELMQMCFGTSDFYSDFFRENGWEAIDIVGNDNVGRRMWAEENNGGLNCGNVETVYDQIVQEKPDIVYCQDLSFLDAGGMRMMRDRYKIKFVAQHSCPWAGDQQVGAFDIVFTSFPHYIPRIKKTGADAHFLPIAFGGKNVLNKVQMARERDLDITFVGGVNGGSGHWQAGTEFLSWIAEMFPEQFKWWGYVIGTLPEGPLSRAYQGPAWGVDMYKIYSRSKIVVNRHGEVAQGYANNMRMFEATGCGAVLLTEAAENLPSYFNPKTECQTYKNTGEAVSQIRFLLEYPDFRRTIGALGHQRTWKTNLYEHRLVPVEKTLAEMVRR